MNVSIQQEEVCMSENPIECQYFNTILGQPVPLKSVYCNMNTSHETQPRTDFSIPGQHGALLNNTNEIPIIYSHQNSVPMQQTQESQIQETVDLLANVKQELKDVSCGVSDDFGASRALIQYSGGSTMSGQQQGFNKPCPRDSQPKPYQSSLTQYTDRGETLQDKDCSENNGQGNPGCNSFQSVFVADILRRQFECSDDPSSDTLLGDLPSQYPICEPPLCLPHSPQACPSSCSTPLIQSLIKEGCDKMPSYSSPESLCRNKECHEKPGPSPASEAVLSNDGNDTCNRTPGEDACLTECIPTCAKHSNGQNTSVPTLKQFWAREPKGIFKFLPLSMPLSIADTHILIEKTLCEELGEVTLPRKVDFVYNPLEYAFETHYQFVHKFCNSEKRVMFLGMNPGPWGMSQNGVPFGEVNIVKDWLEIQGDVDKPLLELPNRRVMGLACKRSEVSGSRFWNLFKSLCRTPETFFSNCFVYNMCPLAFMNTNGKNIPPPMIEKSLRDKMNSICDKALLKMIVIYNVSVIVGIGKFAYDRARGVISDTGVSGVRVEQMLHPSPANPAAHNWPSIAREQLEKMQLLDLIASKSLT